MALEGEEAEVAIVIVVVGVIVAVVGVIVDVASLGVVVPVVLVDVMT